MSSDGLVCAYCAGLVEHGGCASCRAAREQLQRQRVTLPAGPLLALAAVLTVLLVLFAR
jgi:hypothetical protein